MHVQTVKNRSFSPPSLWPGMGLSTAIYIISDTSASYKCLECVMIILIICVNQLCITFCNVHAGLFALPQPHSAQLSFLAPLISDTLLPAFLCPDTRGQLLQEFPA